MSQEFVGRTEDAEAPFLGASFWQVGTVVKGVISKVFDSRPQPDKPPQRCFVLELSEPLEIDGEEWDRVSVGNMAGFKMALQAAKPTLEGLRLKDILTIECTGYKESKKKKIVDGVEIPFSPRVNFKIAVLRG